MIVSDVCYWLFCGCFFFFRKHSNEGLARAGIMEYKHTIQREELVKAISQGARCEADASMTPDDMQVVADHMANSHNPGADETRPQKKRCLPVKAGDKAIDESQKSAHKVYILKISVNNLNRMPDDVVELGRPHCALFC